MIPASSPGSFQQGYDHPTVMSFLVGLVAIVFAVWVIRRVIQRKKPESARRSVPGWLIWGIIILLGFSFMAATGHLHH